MPAVRIENWKGLATAISPYVLAPGATVRQSNLQIRRPGELRQRAGMESVYTAADYSQIVGMYRVSNGIQSSDDLVVCARLSNTQTMIRYQTLVDPTTDTGWSFSATTTVNTASSASPAFAEDRFGRIYIFQGYNLPPLVISKKTRTATPAGMEAPTIAPVVTPSGNGYFIERVDVVDGGGSYWAAPPIVITGGGARVRDARLKAIVQGGSIVAVDVIDGGSGYQTAPTLTVDESTVKGVGFRGYGVIGIDPGIQGLEPVFTVTGNVTSGSATITNVSNISQVRIGSRITGTGMPTNATVSATSSSLQTITISSNAISGAGTPTTLTLNEGVQDLSQNTSRSHGFNLDPNATTIAYSFISTANVSGNTLTNVAAISRVAVGARVTGTNITGIVTVTAVDATTGTVTMSAPATSGTGVTVTFTQGATATFDVTLSQYSALIPLTATSPSAGFGASARVTFGMLTDTLSNQVTSAGGTQDPTWPVNPSGAFFGTSVNTMLSPTQATNSAFYAADWFVNTDDYTIGPNGSSSWFYFKPYSFPNNNYDFFAALCPAFVTKFHSRIPVMENWDGSTTINGQTTNYYSVKYTDAYVMDWSQISLRYYTGSRAELETATDTEDKWVWVTVPVGISGGQPYIDVELVPAKKTGTTAYTQYPGYQTPIVRIYLKYCPDSWVNNTGDNQVNLGYRRVDNATATRPTAQDTAKGWWCAGVSEAGASARPIVDFRTSSVSTNAGITASSVTIVRAGAGMEQGTFFAIQFDQVNAGNLRFTGTTTSDPAPSGSAFKVYPGFSNTYNATWSDMDKQAVSPAWNDEYNNVVNPNRKTKAFGTQRVRFYFWANAVVAGQQGPPGAMIGTPSVAVPGTGFAANDTATFVLRQRSDLTSTATFSNGFRYTFTARQITQPSSTSTISSVVISSGGTNYYGSPALVYAGGGGFGLEMDALVNAGQITQVNVTNGGSGFTSAPLITADSDTARLIPVMRPAMRGTYRCAYRYADWSLTEMGQVNITTVAGSTSVTVASASGISPDMVLESSNTAFMSKVVSLSGTTVTLSRPATATGTVTATIRDMSQPITYSNFSPIIDVDTTTFAAVPNPTQMNWSLPSVTPPNRATVVEFYRTSGDQSLVFYRLEQYGRVSGNSVQIIGSDTLTDEDLFNPDRPFYAALPVVLPNGGLNAYRFGVPRSDMAVCAAYGDRLWYGVSTSGQNANSLFFSVYDEFESCPAENEIAIQNNQKSTDSLTGLIPFATYLLCMQNAHCYGLSYNTDPETDASIQYLAHRGMLAQGCHDLFNDNLFVMDERGIYMMDRSGSVESLSDPIRNWFDNGLLDLTYRNRFFLKVDQRNSILRAFVVTKDSGATSPNMAFCFHVDHKVWWTESWPTGFTCAVDFRRTFLEQDQPIYGCVDGDIYRASGLLDYSYRAIRSITVTNGGSGYKTAPEVRVATGQSGCGARFTPIITNGSVSEIIIDEPGFGYGTLTAGVLNTAVPIVIDPPASGTTATATAECDPLTLGDGKYPQFSVYYAVKTGAMELVNDGNANTKDAIQDRSVSVIYRPTATQSDLYLREFFNNSSQPRVNVMPRDRGTGFVHDTTGAKTRLNMASNRSPLGLATGVAKAQFAGRNYSDMGGADRHVAVELSGPAVDSAQTPSEVLLYGMEVNGVSGSGS